MPVPYQNNMYPQIPYGQQQYGVNSYLPYMQPRFQQPEVPVQQVQQQNPPVQQMPVSQYNNVSAGIYIDVPAGCCANIAVENTSTQAIEVANANLVVTREA